MRSILNLDTALAFGINLSDFSFDAARKYLPAQGAEKKTFSSGERIELKRMLNVNLSRAPKPLPLERAALFLFLFFCHTSGPGYPTTL